MYADSIEIENFRVFGQATAKFINPGSEKEIRTKNVTLLLGNNGSGKTSLLQALCVSLLAPVMSSSSGFVPDFLVRRFGPEVIHPRIKATLRVNARLHAQDSSGKEVDVVLEAALRATGGRLDRFERAVDKWEDKLWEPSSPGYFVVGYGATRRTDYASHDIQSQLKQRTIRYQRVASLFEDYVSLIPLAQWLMPLRSEMPHRFSHVFALINALIPGGIQMVSDKENGIEFTSAGSKIPANALSDGYRAYLGWLADLLFNLNQITGPQQELTDIAGIVLIDEIDLHLHPKWQMHVIKDVSQAFPNLQFIVSSHSPLVVGTLEKKNILVLARNPSTGECIIDSPSEDMRGWSADQILTSEEFGLVSTRDPGVFAEMVKTARIAQSGSIDAADRLMQMLASGALPGSVNVDGVGSDQDQAR